MEMSERKQPKTLFNIKIIYFTLRSRLDSCVRCLAPAVRRGQKPGALLSILESDSNTRQF
jgi:hypothetical protein